MSGRAIRVCLLGLAAAALIASPAEARQEIEAFSSSISTSQAGDHPDVTTSFSLEDPGQPEAASDVIVNLPEGMFGNPNAISRCSVSDYALQQCPTASQAGIITIRANFEGDPEKLLGT